MVQYFIPVKVYLEKRGLAFCSVSYRDSIKRNIPVRDILLICISSRF